MSGIDDLKTRLSYRGGSNQKKRMEQDKFRSLKKSLLYSYQSQTIELNDGRQFRALINTDKLKGDYDNKIISIPFADVCLNENDVTTNNEKLNKLGEQLIGLKCGDVFKWVENGSRWMVYLQYLEESAYFRSDIRRCDQWAEVNGTKYWVYIRGPEATTLQWISKSGINANELNYTLAMYITKDDTTSKYIHRGMLLKVSEGTADTATAKTWRVAAIDPYYGDGIISAQLEEYYEDSIAEKKAEEDAENESTDTPVAADVYIDGPDTFKAFGRVTYTIVGTSGGSWYVSDNDNEIDLSTSEDSVRINDTTGKARTITMIYRTADTDITKDVIISRF